MNPIWRIMKFHIQHILIKFGQIVLFNQFNCLNGWCPNVSNILRTNDLYEYQLNQIISSNILRTNDLVELIFIQKIIDFDFLLVFIVTNSYGIAIFMVLNLVCDYNTSLGNYEASSLRASF